MLKLGVQIVWMFSSVYTLSVLQTSLSLQTPSTPLQNSEHDCRIFLPKKKYQILESEMTIFKGNHRIKNQVIEKECSNVSV